MQHTGSEGSPDEPHSYLHTGRLEHCRRLDDGSRMSREAHVRFCEGLGVQLPRPTHLVIGFQHHDDAERFLKELRERFRSYSLELHPEKTRLIRFGRFATEDCKRKDGRRKPETFNFLGFTHYCGESRDGKFRVKRKTMRKRFTAKLREVKSELRKRMHQSICIQGAWLQAVVRGYFSYHAIPDNGKAIGAFRYWAAKIWYRILRKRSQRNRMTWERMGKIIAQWLPPARILHPWPGQRFAVMTQGRSRMR